MPALATPAFKGLVEANAVRAISARTRMPPGQKTARLARLTDRLRRLRVPIFQTARLSVVWAQRALTEARAQLATPESSRATWAMQTARSAVQEAMRHKMDCENARHVSRASMRQQEGLQLRHVWNVEQANILRHKEPQQIRHARRVRRTQVHPLAVQA